MKRCEFSALIQEDDGNSRELKLELVSVGGDKYQPVVTATDNRTGFSSVNRLPISDYANLRERVSKLFTLDSDGLQKAIRKIMTVFSLIS